MIMKTLSFPVLLTICIFASIATIVCMVMMLTYGQLFYYGLALIFILTGVIGSIKLNQTYPADHKVGKSISFGLLLLATGAFAYPLLVVMMINLFLGGPFRFSDLTL